MSDGTNWLINKIGKIEDKLDSTEVRLDRIEQFLIQQNSVLNRQTDILSTQEKNLQLHMKRSDALEDQNKMLKEYIDRETISIVNSITPIQSHVSLVEKITKYIMVPLILAFIFGAVKLYLG